MKPVEIVIRTNTHFGLVAALLHTVRLVVEQGRFITNNQTGLELEHEEGNFYKIDMRAPQLEDISDPMAPIKISPENAAKLAEEIRLHEERVKANGLVILPSEDVIEPLVQGPSVPVPKLGEPL